ncbi:MobH family relaxase [Marinobacterium rhizophilum]|uniref:TraI domain-containing protein n=1 Tax=Marinobacterium rhizophilum TaxID=420402 RepID=A0ABY5HIY8_9GAMM|nr:MobH family relaxase [Marinobacterium rhizophilum]UTW12346.1 TraI domain-containing protein [Marinobacterium rhizophilum]
MLSLLRRKWPPPVPETSVSQSPEFPNDLPAGLFQPESATSLLATPRRQKLLEHIWQRTALSHQQFAWLYRAPLERYAELVQQFPASESHHHAYPGGMLDHGLEIVAYALKLRQSHLLPAGASPEDQSAQSEAWTAATAYAALLHDIGKLAVDMHVEYEDGGIWHPWHGPLQQPYRFRYRDNRVYRLHSAATGLLYHQLFDRNILDWLSDYPALWSALLYVLAGQYEHAGVLGDLVIQADRASVAQELSGDPAKAMAAPKHALQRKLLDGLRYLLKQELKLNQPQASDGWLTQDALWLVSKTVSDKLRAHLLSQGIDGIPANNSAVFDVLQDHGILQPNPEGKAIWKATITSETGWSHSFTLLRLAPALIWEANERPEPFTGSVTVETPNAETTSAIDAVPNIDPGADIAATAPPGPPSEQDSKQEFANETAPKSAQNSDDQPDVIENLLSMLDMPDLSSATTLLAKPTDSANTAANANDLAAKPLANSLSSTQTAKEQPSGEHFMSWLKQGIQSRKLIINDAKALVHTVANTVFLVSPGVFQRYAQEHPQIATKAKDNQQQDWQWIQKRFEKMQLHRKQQNGLNIWTCEVTGPRKSRRLHGYLLQSPSHLFDEIPLNNSYLDIMN